MTKISNSDYDLAIGKVMVKRESLRIEQCEARKLLHKAISERKRVVFAPSEYWQKKIAGKERFALAAALDEEGVEPISYSTDGLTSRLGKVLSITLDRENRIVIRVLDMGSGQEIDIFEENTWDVDYLLEFIQKFGSESIEEEILGPELVNDSVSFDSLNRQDFENLDELDNLPFVVREKVLQKFIFHGLLRHCLEEFSIPEEKHPADEAPDLDELDPASPLFDGLRPDDLDIPEVFEEYVS